MFLRLSRLSRDDGASAVFVVIVLAVIFGAGALAIDAGSLWHTRRDLIADTDSASLAAASFLLENGPAACTAATTSPTSAARTEATGYLAKNDAETSLGTFSVTPYGGDCSSRAGRVEVTGSKPADLTFASILGVDSANVQSRSVAQYGAIKTATGLRPIGICVDNSHVQEWIAVDGDTSSPAYAALWGVDDALCSVSCGHPAYGDPSTVGVVHRIYFTKEMEGSCGDSAGSWGWLDFNGSTPPNGADALKEWLESGYDGQVTLGGPGLGDEDCEMGTSAYDDCEANSGANASTKAKLEGLTCPATTETGKCRSFAVVVYDHVEGTGSNADYHHVGFLGVVLRGFNKVTGTPTDESYFDLEFVELQWQGVIGPDPGGPVPPLTGVQLCGGGYASTNDTKCDV
ncbi:MAG: hypothetical protein ACRDHM_01905 [Actinomycetota bacterium]